MDVNWSDKFDEMLENAHEQNERDSKKYRLTKQDEKLRKSLGIVKEDKLAQIEKIKRMEIVDIYSDSEASEF